MTRAVTKSRAVSPATKKAKTLVVNFVLDETGSMSTVWDATISGFNEYVSDLRKQGEDILFTLTKFNSEAVDVVHEAVPIKKVVALNRDNYRPMALTPLYDAVAASIRATEGRVNGKEPVLCVIQTDGQENASREYNTLDKIRALIEQKTREGWTFAYLGADQDAWAIGGQMGVPQASTMSYAGTPDGTKTAFAAVADSTLNYASSGGKQTDSFFKKGKREK